MNPGGLFVSSSGNVGIGLINPGVALDISGYSRVTGVGLNSTPTSIGANPNYVRLTNTGGDLYLGQEGSTNGGFFVGSLAYDSVLYSGRSINSIINGVSRMYINSSGSVGIGNTNPTYRLDIFSGSDFDIRLRDTSLGGTVGILFETANDFSGTSQAYIKGIGAGNSGVSQLIFGTAGASGDTTATERMRITSAGNVGIGTTSPNSNPGYASLTINGSTGGQITLRTADSTIGYLYTTSANFVLGSDTSKNLIFDAGATERMRITSTGAATFRTNSDSVFDLLTLYNISATSSGVRLRFQNGFGDLAGIRVSQRDNGALADDGLMEFQVGSNASLGTKLSIRNDGLVAFPQINDFTTGNSPNTWINPASSYGIYINTSSIRYKRDVINYDRGIDTVNQLRPVYYKGKSDIDGDKQFAGFIAEEIHDLGLTEFVQYNEDGLPNSLAYPNMITLAIKAIQELKAEFDEYKTTHP
jgi:hypothetical protein